MASGAFGRENGMGKFWEVRLWWVKKCSLAEGVPLWYNGGSRIYRAVGFPKKYLDRFF